MSNPPAPNTAIKGYVALINKGHFLTRYKRPPLKFFVKRAVHLLSDCLKCLGYFLSDLLFVLLIWTLGDSLMPELINHGVQKRYVTAVDTCSGEFKAKRSNSSRRNVRNAIVAMSSMEIYYGLHKTGFLPLRKSWGMREMFCNTDTMITSFSFFEMLIEETLRHKSMHVEAKRWLFLPHNLHVGTV